MRNKTIGEKIKIARVVQGLTQKSLAEKIGKTSAWLSQVETNKVKVKTEILEKIAASLEVPTAVFFDENLFVTKCLAAKHQEPTSA